MPSRDFDALKFLGTLGWVPLEERLRLRNLHLACGDGLSAARQGRLDEAWHHYQQAEEHLGRLEGGARTAWLLGVSTYEAGVAYLDFRCGDSRHASERLDRAMDADLELEQTGLPVMQMHRIQQGHNLARMDLRLGRREAAVGLAGLLLAYMERRIDRLPYHRNWQSRSLQAVPRRLLQTMIHEVIGETATFIATGETPTEEWHTLLAASLCPDPETSFFPQVQYALRARYDRLMGDPEGYLRNLERFFHLGIRRCHLLWYAMMVELVCFCGEVGTRHSGQVLEMILHDSAKWKGLPTFLRPCFDAPAAQRTVA
jgi:hypothetical protein